MDIRKQNFILLRGEAGTSMSVLKGVMLSWQCINLSKQICPIVRVFSSQQGSSSVLPAGIGLPHLACAASASPWRLSITDTLTQACTLLHVKVSCVDAIRGILVHAEF